MNEYFEKITLGEYIETIELNGFIDTESWDNEFIYVLNNLKELQLLQQHEEELQQYIENIDDRNSLKLQKVKDDMVKILKKEK